MHTLLPTIGISDVNQFNRATASRLRARTDGTAGTGLAWSGIKLASAPSPQSDAPALFASTGGTRGSSDAASRNVWLSGYGLDGDLDGDAQLRHIRLSNQRAHHRYRYRYRSELDRGAKRRLQRLARAQRWPRRSQRRQGVSDRRLRAIQRRADPRRRRRRLRQRRLRDRSPHRVRHDQPHSTRRLQRRAVHRQPGRTLPHRARALRHRAVRGSFNTCSNLRTVSSRPARIRSI